MAIAYFDCFSGAAGDMILGAFVDAGLPLALLRRKLRLLPIGAFELKLHKGPDFSGANLCVIAGDEPAHADYQSLDKAIAGSKLAKDERDLARAILSRLAHAEARVHGMPVDKVHFHEVGATDSIVDIVGAAIAVHHFGFDRIHCSPLPMSRGNVKCRHGVLPVPAPATLELLKGVPLERTEVKQEMVTPTGAAILTEICSHFGSCPLQVIERTGSGFGDRRIEGRPNMLRLLIGEGFPAVVLETDIDDMNSELFGPLMEKLLRAGAADATLEPIQMKKGRPGIRLRCVSPWDFKDRLMDMILAETTTFGVRYWPVERKMLTREFVKGKVKHGSMTFKIGRDAKGRIVKAMPEFEDVKRLARKTRRPLPEVYAEALAASLKLKR
jgi:hypothetical protein